MAADFMAYLAAFRQRLTGDYIPAEEAERYLNYMRIKHSDVLDEWLTDHARQWVTIELGRMRRSERARFNAGTKARSFANLARKHMAGEINIADVFETEYVIDDRNTTRKLGAMTRPDLLYVADQYEATGRRALLQAAYFKVVAKKTGNRTVAEAFTAEDLLKLHERVMGHKPGTNVGGQVA